MDQAVTSKHNTPHDGRDPMLCNCDGWWHVSVPDGNGEYIAHYIDVTTLLDEIDRLAPQNVFTLEQVREKNKHLSARTQQTMLDRSQGIIETNNQWRAVLNRFRSEK